MRLPVITCVLLACVCLSAGDVAHLKAAKAKLVGRLLGKHHKRGIYSAVPTFKLGHDIPVVSHSVVKPLVVTYPPTASVANVKVPVSPPFGRFPISVAHRPHSHFGVKHNTKTVVVPKPDQHFHHHHHHIAPKPVLPVLPPAPALPAAPVVPFPQPTATAVHPVPAPAPGFLVQTAAASPQPIFPPQPLPIARPPIPSFPHFPLKQLIPLAPIQPAAAVPAPAFPLSPQYVLRPGNAVQTSFFATYPRYPLLNYQSSLLPLAAPPVLPAPIAPAGPPLLFDRPHLHNLLPQPDVHDGIFEHASPGIAVEPTPGFVHPTQAIVPQAPVHLHPAQPTAHLQPVEPTVHLHTAQPQDTVHLHPTPSAVPLDHDGWSPVPAGPQDLSTAQLDNHFLDTHHFTQEQSNQVYEHHTGGEQQYHDYQNQLQHHIQHQIDQAQYEQNLNNQHQPNQEYGAPQQEYGQPNEYTANPNFAEQAHEYAHHVQEYAQHGQEYAHHGQEYAQHGQEYAQPGQEYGLPQGIEGRSSDADEDTTQRYHNHIPLGLQPPIDRPLEHFR